jgi:DNA polymerase-3 subunit gamma/tau
VAYTVLARKYRSRTFTEVIGQEPIATTLVNAIKTGRIHHGYLFTGTRGVGKTSMARILAKALNCLNADGPTTTPCCECDACVAIAEGQDIDVVEIDAASNTGVDNIRELRSNTAYRPARARFKVYIIDEVHMLSTGAFNALLKTLEEPPGHVKFILATTEIQKVPATIQSRCQRFNFRNIGPEAITDRLAQIVKDEGATAEAAALRRVARLANGSMRDALSVLDQLLSVAPECVTAAVLDEILPPAQDEQVLGLIRHAAAGDAAAVLAAVDALLAQGRGLDVFCHDMIETVRNLMLVRACGPDAPMVDLPAGSRDDYVNLSREFELSQYVQMIAMLEELRRTVRFSGAGRALTDALMVRLAHMRQWAPIEELLAEISPEEAGSDEKKKPTVRPAAVAAEHERRPPAQPPPPPRVAKPLTDQPIEDSVYGAEPPPVVPEDYVPSEALPTAPPRVPAGPSLSSGDRARIMQDPVVRQVLDLFDGELVYVDRRPAEPACEPSE